VVNDPEQNERIGTLCDAKENGDVRVFGWVTEGIVNLNDFSPGSFKTCRGHMRDLILARQVILRSKKTSGEHCDGTWNYCSCKHLMVRKGVVMPETPVYYLDLMCRTYPDIDAAYDVALEENLVSTSTQEPEVNAAKSAQKDKFLRVFETANDSISKSQKEASEHRQKLIQLHEKKDMSNLWAEYATLLQTVIEMSDAPSKQRILRNLAACVKILETSLSIHPSSSCLNGISNLD
jgi:flagellar hook-basal body complex protein FliE